MALRSMTEGIRRALWDAPRVRTLVHRRRAQQAASALDLSSADRLPILVYRMPRIDVGTVVRTLDAIGLGRPIHPLHFLMPGPLEFARRAQAGAPGGPPYDWCLGERLGARLRKARPGLPLPIVTLVRDPIARLGEQVAGACDAQPAPAAEVQARFEREARRDEVWKGPEAWFRDELREMFGIDVFALPFAKHRGHALYRSSQARVLLLRVEDLADALGPALAEFLDLPEPAKLVRHEEPRAAVASNARALEGLRLPRERVQAIYARRLTRHFYDDATLQRFIARWSE